VSRFIVERLYQPNIAPQIEALTRLLEEAMGRPSGATNLERDGLSMAVGGARHGEWECSEARQAREVLRAAGIGLDHQAGEA